MSSPQLLRVPPPSDIELALLRQEDRGPQLDASLADLVADRQPQVGDIPTDIAILRLPAGEFHLGADRPAGRCGSTMSPWIWTGTRCSRRPIPGGTEGAATARATARSRPGNSPIGSPDRVRPTDGDRASLHDDARLRARQVMSRVPGRDRLRPPGPEGHGEGVPAPIAGGEGIAGWQQGLGIAAAEADRAQVT